MNDWSEGAKLAVAAIILVVIISLVFGFLYLTLNASSNSQERLASQLADFDNRAFDAYDQMEITGSQVIGAIKQFKDQPVAVIVETLADPGKAVNYCATIGTAGTSAPSPFSGGASASVVPTDAGNGKYTLSGKVVWKESQNNNTQNVTKKSSKEYINNAGRFLSNLVYDENNEIIGIYLKQTK